MKLPGNVAVVQSDLLKRKGAERATHARTDGEVSTWCGLRAPVWKMALLPAKGSAVRFREVTCTVCRHRLAANQKAKPKARKKTKAELPPVLPVSKASKKSAKQALRDHFGGGPYLRAASHSELIKEIVRRDCLGINPEKWAEFLYTEWARWAQDNPTERDRLFDVVHPTWKELVRTKGDEREVAWYRHLAGRVVARIVAELL